MRPMGFRIDTEIESTKTIVMPCDFQHGICTGMTGSGKTASLVLPIMKDRLERGHGILAYTYKGHEHRKIKYLAQKVGRLEDVIEIGKPHGSYINLMASLEQNAIRRVLESLIAGRENRKDYWTLSASRLGANIVDILRKINKVEALMQMNFQEHVDIRQVKIEEKRDDEKIFVNFIYPQGEPSFKILAEMTKSPRILKRFYSGLDELIDNIRNAIQYEKLSRNIERMTYSLFDDKSDKEQEEDILAVLQKVTVALLRLEKVIEPYKDFSINVNSEDASGNNGVLQVLNNAVLSLTSKDYINTDDIDIFDALSKGAIVIIDIEGIAQEIHSVMLDTILNKLATRIRQGIFNPTSVFVDEANRVLSKDMDIHNDVLREAKVEVILATQNEEQMIEKFGLVKWNALRQNFKHSYWIDQRHKVTYNEQKSWSAKALLIDDIALLEAEYAFNALEKNQTVYKNRFMDSGDLPEKFSVEYDIVHFERTMTLYLVDDESEKKEVEYIGNDLKQKLEKEMAKLEHGSDNKLQMNI